MTNGAVLGWLNMCINLVSADTIYITVVCQSSAQACGNCHKKAKQGRLPSDIGQIPFEMACEKLEA